MIQMVLVCLLSYKDVNYNYYLPYRIFLAFVKSGNPHVDTVVYGTDSALNTYILVNIIIIFTAIFTSFFVHMS